MNPEQIKESLTIIELANKMFSGSISVADSLGLKTKEDIDKHNESVWKALEENTEIK